ncbi:MAG: hypothetical protein ACEPOV_08400 [Hyphomicrobiales bacterium]
MKKKKVLLLLILLCLLLIFLIPIKLPYSFKATGKIYPIKTWQLLSSEISEFKIKEINYLSGSTRFLSDFKFQENDIVNYNVNSSLKNFKKINCKDTIAIFSSLNLNQNIDLVSNMIVEEQLLLKSESCGRKDDIINSIKAKKQKANYELILAKKEFDRTSKLHNDNIISQAIYDASFNKLKIAESNLKEVSHLLKSASSGLKDEVINWRKSKIESLEERLSTLCSQRHQYTLTSPFNGIVQFPENSEELITIEDTDSLVLIIPIRYRDNKYVSKGHNVLFSAEGSFQQYKAVILDKDQNVQNINQQQVIFVKALILDKCQKIIPNLLVSGKFQCEPVSLFEYLSRSLQIFIN